MSKVQNRKPLLERLSWLLAGVFIAVGIDVVSRHVITPRNEGTPLVRVSAKQNQLKSISGSWGVILVDPFPLKWSETYFYDKEKRLTSDRWAFSGTNLSIIQESIARLTKPQELASEVAEAGRWRQDKTHFVFQPTSTFLTRLTPESRAELYRLAGDNGNYSQQWPYRFTEHTFAERFGNSGLNKVQVKQIRDLCYWDCNLISFCDVALLQKNFDEKSFDELIRVLNTIPSLRVRLHLCPSDSVTNLLAYWGRNQSVSRVKPILETLTSTSEGNEINICALLPPFARTRLYGYPDAKTHEAESRMDCFFTGMNFFNDAPDLRYLDNQVVKSRLKTKFRPVGNTPIFGDLLVLISAEGEAIHMAVYIADDIVFTKNGMTETQPWTLMKIEDMLTYFPTRTPSKIYFVREIEDVKAVTYHPVANHD
ncbi:MAG: hypothetical protein JWN25_2681 [Verrucomicrobiales bacterium]|nr:hypothetical protein [Verrucomicrobiales bacterium]